MKKAMNAEQMIKAIDQQNELIKQKDELISKLVHLLADKTAENDTLKVALLSSRQDDEYDIIFEPEWDSAH